MGVGCSELSGLVYELVSMMADMLSFKFWAQYESASKRCGDGTEENPCARRIFGREAFVYSSDGELAVRSASEWLIVWYGGGYVLIDVADGSLRSLFTGK